MVYRAISIVREFQHTASGCPGCGAWFPAQPFRYESIFTRIWQAWGVLTGRYDVLDWSHTCDAAKEGR